MTEPLDPLGPVTPERRKRARRHSDPPPPPVVEGERANVPALLAVDPHAPAPPAGAAAFAAQLMGQDGQKRGLRGGRPVLRQARSAYLGTEYSGPHDRRPRRGVIAKTDI